MSCLLSVEDELGYLAEEEGLSFERGEYLTSSVDMSGSLSCPARVQGFPLRS